MRFRGDGDFVNAEDKIHETALTYASSRGHTTCVRVLLAHGADPGHCTKNGDTALVFAINHCQSQSNLDVVCRGYVYCILYAYMFRAMAKFSVTTIVAMFHYYWCIRNT